MSFRAQVSPRILEKVTRLFNASLTDIFNEVMQNSRRAGASRIDVGIDAAESGSMITIHDDGAGIADPASLLMLGDSGWSPDIRSMEDPAGMGLFSLSMRGAVIASRRLGQDMAWRTELTPRHFLGQADILFEQIDHPVGTTIRFADTGKPALVQSTLSLCARHYPLPVHVNGEEVERRDFLDGAIHRAQWNGLLIGVVSHHSWLKTPTINFHGLVIEEEMPVIRLIGDARLSVRIDAQNCPDLQLVLPARKEVVKTPFLDDLKTACRRILFEAIADRPGHSLSHADWTMAKALGVTLPPAKAELPLFEPRTADERAYCGKRTALPANALVVYIDPEAPVIQCFCHAFDRSQPEFKLFQRQPEYEGYVWYDALPKLTEISFHGRGNNGWIEIDPFPAKSYEKPFDALEIRFTVVRNGTPSVHTLPTPMLLTSSDDYCSVDEVWPLLTPDDRPSVEALTDLIVASYFSHSEDAEADSWQTQLYQFTDEARDLARGLLLGDTDRLRAAIGDAIDRHIRWLLPEGMRLDMRHDADGLAFALTEGAPSDSECPKLAVIVEGGMLQGIVSDRPERFAGIPVLVIDYDVRDFDGAVDIPQGDGSQEPALAYLDTIGQAAIDIETAIDNVRKSRLAGAPESQ